MRQQLPNLDPSLVVNEGTSLRFSHPSCEGIFGVFSVEGVEILVIDSHIPSPRQPTTTPATTRAMAGTKVFVSASLRHNHAKSMENIGMRLLNSNARHGQAAKDRFHMPRPTIVPANAKICQPMRRDGSTGGFLATSQTTNGSSKSPARHAVCAVYTIPGMRPEISRDSRLYSVQLQLAARQSRHAPVATRAVLQFGQKQNHDTRQRQQCREIFAGTFAAELWAFLEQQPQTGEAAKYSAACDTGVYVTAHENPAAQPMKSRPPRIHKRRFNSA